MLERKDQRFTPINRTILELKRTNFFDIIRNMFSINRTILELKQEYRSMKERGEKAINRTILELKQVEGEKMLEVLNPLLIEPFWN